MGFAGQVFAARVAIGLAVPSQQALQETGGIISTGAEKIYERLGAVRAKHGAISAANYKAQLKDLLNVTKSNQSLLTSAMTQGVAKAYDGMTKMGQESLKGIFKKGQYKKYSQGVKGALGKDLHKKIFAGVGGLQNTAARVQKIQKNIIKMTKEERVEALKNLEVQKNSARVVLSNLKDEQASLENKKLVTGKISTAEQKRYDSLVTKKIPAQKEELRVADQNLRKTKEIIESVGEQTGKIQESAKSFKEMGFQTVKAGSALKAGFNDVLRNSIGLLAAFTYKLNQHTQELITFERELINANSVWGMSNEELYTASAELLKFSNQYGISLENASAGMYQLASAGLTLAEAEEVIKHTLLLSMAVQGDHNTIAKLTTQIIKGYGMEMSEAGRLTDMMAHAIQKSLIEWQDLSSAVKFALPFFTSTNQEIEVLIGSLMILTDRALEAGIAGRGLRQGLAEFAESAMDSSSGFSQMGIEIVNAEGEMRQLTDIAMQFHEKVDAGVISNTELLTTLIEGLNVRGATAFVHLVQNAELFQETVDNVKASGGELTEMADIQNESLSAQLEILKSNVKSIFMMGDATHRAEGYMSAFHKEVVLGVQSLTGLIVETVDGEQQLTTLGKEIENVAVNGVKVLVQLIGDLVETLGDLTKEGLISYEMLKLMVYPMEVMLKVLNFLGPDMIKIIIWLKVINSLMPAATMNWIAGSQGLFSLAAGFRAVYLASGLAVAVGALWVGKKAINWYKNRESGGYVHGGMGQGGPMQAQPYMVGEQGPEMFVPGQSGKILNSSQTRDILAGNFNSGTSMNNNTLVINRAVMKNTSIGIDSFGGIA